MGYNYSPCTALQRARRGCSNGTNIGGDYSEEEVAFGAAMEAWKETHHNRFPTCRDVLAVARALGYRRVVLS